MNPELSGLNDFLKVIEQAHNALEKTCREELNALARTTTGYGIVNIAVPVSKKPMDGVVYVLTKHAHDETLCPKPQLFVSISLPAFSSTIEPVTSSSSSSAIYILTPGIESMPVDASSIAPGMYVIGLKNFYQRAVTDNSKMDSQITLFNWSTAKQVGAQTVEWYKRILKELRVP